MVGGMEEIGLATSIPHGSRKELWENLPRMFSPGLLVGSNNTPPPPPPKKKQKPTTTTKAALSNCLDSEGQPGPHFGCINPSDFGRTLRIL